MFKNFYRTGETRCEGNFLSIDSTDGMRSVFDGDIVMFNKNGTVAPKAHYADGKLTGDYYLLADSAGNTLKYRITDDSPVWESPSLAERIIEYKDGMPYEIYFKNGLTITLKCAIKRDYGKWFRVDMIITNHSLTPIEVTPENNITAVAFDEQNMPTDLQVRSYDEYMKKVNRSQTWSAILMDVSEGLSTAGAGYSTSTTTVHSSHGGSTSFRTSTYSPTAAAQTNLASQQRIANFSQALQNDRKIKQLGYLKKNTIYPGESVSGFVHIDCDKGLRLVVNVNIEGAEYLYEWGIGKQNTFILEK